MEIIYQNLNFLGLTVKDKVTGFKGVATSISFDLYGCIQALVNPGLDNNKKTQDQTWFDVARLEVISKKPVMELPSYLKQDGHVIVNNVIKGPSEKPKFNKA